MHDVKDNGRQVSFTRDLVSFIVLLVVVLALWGGGWYLIDHHIGVSELDPKIDTARAAFGDKFGALNALFSALAFAGIIFTILLQRRELSFQRAEIRESRRQVEKQNILIERQRFESTFFKLLQLQGELVSKLDFLGKKGLDALETYQVALKEADPEYGIYLTLRKLDRQSILNIKAGIPDILQAHPHLDPSDVTIITEALRRSPGAFDTYLDADVEMHRAKIKCAYEKVSSKYLEHFSHYFRGLYHIVSFVDSYENLEEKDKRAYAKMVRAQLSDSELMCLFYNSLTNYSVPGRTSELGYPKFGQLLAKYEFMHNMNWLSIFHLVHKDIFANSNKDGE